MKNIITVTITFFFISCTSIMTIDQPKLYSGLRLDYNGLTGKVYDEITSTDPLGGIIMGAFILIDLPFSFVADTTLLPYKFYLIATEPEKPPIKKDRVKTTIPFKPDATVKATNN